MSEGPVTTILHHAMEIKSAEMASYRKQFDSWPSWIRNSLVADSNVMKGRETDIFDEKMAIAKELKDKGKVLFRENKYDAAISEFEKALSVFNWIETTNPNWRTEGIRDSQLRQHRFVPANNNDELSLRSFTITCLLNLSASFIRLSLFSDCIRACNSVLELDSDNAKALYRRAQANIIAPSATLYHNDLALQDLQHALSILPNDRAIYRTYVDLKRSIDFAKEKHRRAYQGAFLRNSGEKKVQNNQGDCSSEKGADQESNGGGFLGDDEVQSTISSNTTLSTVPGIPPRSSPIRMRKSLFSEDQAINDSVSVANFNDRVSVSSSVASSIQSSIPPAKRSGGRSDVTRSSESVASTNSHQSSTFSERQRRESKKLEVSVSEAVVLIQRMEAAVEYLEKQGDFANAAVIRNRVKVARAGLDSHMLALAKRNEESNSDGEVPDGAGVRSNRSNSSSSNYSSSTTSSSSNASNSFRGMPGVELQSPDFTNPSPELIEEARRHGIDLTNKDLQDVFSEFAKETLTLKERGIDGQPLDESFFDDANPEKLALLVSMAMIRFRRRMANDIAVHVVDSIEEKCYKEMLISRRCGVYHRRSEREDLKYEKTIPPSSRQVFYVTEDELLERAVILQKESEESLRSMLIDSVADDIMDLEKPPLPSESKESESKTDDNKDKDKDNNNDEDKNDEDSDEGEVDEKKKYSRKILKMIMDYYGGPKIVELRSVNRKKRERSNWIRWVPIIIATLFGLFFIFTQFQSFLDTSAPKKGPTAKVSSKYAGDEF